MTAKARGKRKKAGTSKGTRASKGRGAGKKKAAARRKKAPKQKPKTRARRIWHFEPGQADGRADMRPEIGGKGANLAEMCRIGLPVPAGFTIGTGVSREFLASGREISPALERDIRAALRRLEKATGKGFGDPTRPLLVSVRSGAAVSMPGMMDTVLNLGLTAAAAEGLAQQSGNERFALDARRRFIQMYSDVVEGIPHEHFEQVLDRAMRRAGVDSETELSAEHMGDVVEAFLTIYKRETRTRFPEDPVEQLLRTIAAVFNSWENDRAVEYRDIHGLPHDMGTAVTVQSMVFGNLGEDSGTGVCFTRDPSTGEDVFYGEYLMNAQGEDVVAGIRTPDPLDELESRHPRIYAQLAKVRRTLERHYKDMQDIEFTIEEGSLYILQTRSGKRTAAAGVRIAVEMSEKRLLSRGDALARVSAEDLDKLLHPQFDPKAERDVMTRGLPASPGAVSGRIVFTAHAAKEAAAQGTDVILVRNETSPEDIGGMHAAVGILTATGGMTSHAAVVARGMGTCCVAGASQVRIDLTENLVRIGARVLRAGDVISLDGTTGEVMAGSVRTMPADPGSHFDKLLGWADRARRLRVRANADTPEDARVARRFGAEGIGLCRTEHMFFGDERITPMREMILATSEDERRAALKQLLPFQRKDFTGILKEMDGFPVTIRLLDPPLHEFLPHDEEAVRRVARHLGLDQKQVRERAERLRETNPMLGHRGCRLGISHPEIYEMQVRAIFEAAATLARKGKSPMPEVMIPLVGTVEEFVSLRDRLVEVATRVLDKKGQKIKIIMGTMIEVPRATLVAEAIGAEAQFFSFGTNDLTQLTYGFSRDDIGSFLPDYLEQGILASDPFQTIDRAGVGTLIRLATTQGRSARPKLKVGICGEHGGDPRSIAFCHEQGLDYVSCSPFRIPIARLAAAHAAL